MSIFGGNNPASPRQKTKSGKTLYTPADEPTLGVGGHVRQMSSDDGYGCLQKVPAGWNELEDGSWIKVEHYSESDDCIITEISSVSPLE